MQAGGGYDRTAKVLVWLLLIVTVGCWAGMIAATYVTYQRAAPLPDAMVTRDGRTVMTRADIVAGKSGFQKADLMDYGSLYGMGSYFGEDYTAKYLVQLGKQVEDNLAHARHDMAFSALNDEQQLGIRHAMQQELQGIDLSKRRVVLPDAVAQALGTLRGQIAAWLLKDDFAKGYTRAYSLDPASATQTTNFLLYSSLTTVARRPDRNYSWTINWPAEPLVGNTPTPATFEWTWISFTLVFFGIGAVVAIFRIFIEPKHGEFSSPATDLGDFIPSTPSQRALWKYFLVVAAVLLVQILAGAIMAHYYTERAGFYGVGLDKWLPFAFLRAVHLQSPIVWIGVSWIGAGLFLAPLIGGREPKGQRFLVNLIFWVLVVIVAGALLGNYLGIMGDIDKSWFWFGNQGLSYLELGRFWQILFFVGLLVWSLVLLRAFWPTLKSLFTRNKSLYGLFRIEHLLWYSTLGVAVIYAFGMVPLGSPNPSFAITDFWRWWVVHLWVEWAFELFTAAITGYFLMALGLVSRKLVERAVLFEWILILVGGILGTGHHMYWVGEPGLWIGVGSMFSFLEVLPLVLLVLEAIEQRRHIEKNSRFPYRLAYLYIIGSAFWNFVGAGVFGGGTLNAPLVNYYEHGTFLTLNHAHTSMFGAFGMLAIGLVYMVLRHLNGERPWSDRLGVWAFWLYNLGMVMWIVLNFYPVGWPQLEAVYEHGYAYARSLQFYNTTLIWQWLRMPGDIVFAVAAVLMSWDFVAKLWRQWKAG
jgi:nitric oxide reductase subunit B